MRNPDLRRYERDLKKSIRGIRLRKKVLEEYRRCLVSLLEDQPDPRYEDLNGAFGPPEQFGAALARSLDHRPLSHGAKLAVVLGSAAILVCVGVLVGTAWNTPETGAFLPDAASLTVDDFPDAFSAVMESFSYGDVEWDQLASSNSYLVLAHNTNEVTTTVSIRYRKHKAPHTFSIPPGDTVAFVVNGSKHAIHTISFDTPDGTLSGTVRVLVSEDVIAAPSP